MASAVLQGHEHALDDRRLTTVEATALDELEQVIAAGIATFVAVGRALEHIRDQRLYRERYGSFEVYCRERWGISRSYAYRQMEAAHVAEIVSPNGDTPSPVTESVARELGPLKDDPEQVRAAWQETVEQNGSEPTAKELREVVDRRCVEDADHGQDVPVTHGPLSPKRERQLQNVLGGALGHPEAAVFVLPELEQVKGYDREELLGDLRRLRLGISRLINAIEARPAREVGK